MSTTAPHPPKIESSTAPLSAETQTRIRTLRHRAEKLPRIPLTFFPTPLHECPRLAAAIGGKSRLFMKRDDVMTVGLGGNKIRKLEFSLGQARAQGCDVVIHGLAVQSNYCRLTAAACAQVGIECRLVLRSDSASEEVPQANLLLDQIFGAKITRATTEKHGQAKEQLVAELKAQGRKPYLIGDYDEEVGAIGYSLGVAEILEQMALLEVRPDYLCVTGSRGTQAGLILGKRLLGFPGPVLAFDVSPSADEVRKRARIAALVNKAAALLGVAETFTIDDVFNTDIYGGPQYGVPTKECLETIALAGKTEGILVSPTYTAKGLTGTLDSMKNGRIKPGSNVVFVHTGGIPEIFAFNRELALASAP